MRDREPSHNGHRLSERWLNDAIPHAYNQEEEERERIPKSVKHRNDNHQHIRSDVIAMPVLVVVEAPCHEHFQDQEGDDGRNVVLHRQDIVSVLDIEEAPEYADYGVNYSDTPIER